MLNFCRETLCSQALESEPDIPAKVAAPGRYPHGASDWIGRVGMVMKQRFGSIIRKERLKILTVQVVMASGVVPPERP
jgi:hypothetical protein